MQFLIDVTLTLFYLAAFFLICAWTWRFWKMYVNQKWLNKFQKDCILLEIKLPRDIFKSPYAMEVALTAFLQGGGVGTWYVRNIQGALVSYASLEIASLEGVIHFYIRTPKKFRDLIEANLYAQYPGIEISLAEDYTSRIKYHHLSKDVDLWGSSYPLAKKWTPQNKSGEFYAETEKDKEKKKWYKMPADYLPIKTYVDYGLDKDPKEEFKTDPITPLLEFMGSLGKGEYVWYQVLIQDEGKYNDEVFPKSYINDVSDEHMTLADMANARKKQIRTSGYIKPGDKVFDDYGDPLMKPSGEKDDAGNPILVQREYKIKEPKSNSKSEQALTQEEKDEIEMINRKLSKPILRAVVRLMYIAKKESFNYGHIQNIITIMKHFGNNSVSANGFGLNPVDPYSYPWENTLGRRLPWRKEEMFEEFVEREGFFPHIGKRTSLDKSEDLFFWTNSMQARKKWRMLYEALFYPFDHPHPEVISLNLEELATLWHFPGAVAGTPTLPRIDSTKGVAPVNLPQ